MNGPRRKEWISITTTPTSGAETIGRAILNWFFNKINLNNRIIKYTLTAEPEDFVDSLDVRRIGEVLVTKHGLWNEFMAEIGEDFSIAEIWVQCEVPGALKKIHKAMYRVVGEEFKKLPDWKQLEYDVKALRRQLKKVEEVIES